MRMEESSKHATVSLSKYGDIVEVQDEDGEGAPALDYEPARIDGRCPEGHEVTEIKRIPVRLRHLRERDCGNSSMLGLRPRPAEMVQDLLTFSVDSNSSRLRL
jgi:hypothetical protein